MLHKTNPSEENGFFYRNYNTLEGGVFQDYMIYQSVRATRRLRMEGGVIILFTHNAPLVSLDSRTFPRYLIR